MKKTMSKYALLHGVCGLAEGYSSTTVRWYKTLDEAMEAKQKSLAGLMMAAHESVISSTDGMQDIIVFDDLNGEQEIIKIIPYTPVFDNEYIHEYLVWNQMETHAEWGGGHLPNDMGVMKDLCERLESVADEVSVDILHEFVRDLWYGKKAMFDADDICIYYFRIPKSK
jgi:hypothetical protein